MNADDLILMDSKNRTMPLSPSLDGRLRHQHETIAELAGGIPEEQLKIHVVADKWSAFENIVHLAAYQPAFIDRLSAMLKGERPLFQRYVAENDPLFYRYLAKPLSELLNIIAGDRQIIYDSVHGLSADQLRLVGQHTRYGQMTIAQWTEFFVLHEAHHLWTMAQLVSALRAGAHE
jgi:hypothetical protein